MPFVIVKFKSKNGVSVLLDFSLTVKAATLIFGRGSAISSAKEGKSGFIYTL